MLNTQIIRFSKFSRFTAQSNIAPNIIENQKLAILQKQCQEMLRTRTDGNLRYYSSYNSCIYCICQVLFKINLIEYLSFFNAIIY
jgi:hypothetical protein